MMEKATYFSAIDVLKDFKDSISSTTDFNKATIKLIGRESDINSALKRIEEEKKTIKVERIHLSFPQHQTWKKLIESEPEKLKGVYKMIHEKSTVTVNYKAYEGIIELAGIPDVIQQGKQLIEDIVNNSPDSYYLSILPEESFLLFHNYLDEVNSSLVSIPQSSLNFLSKLDRINFKCPKSEKDNATTIIKTLIATLKSTFFRSNTTIDPKHNKIVLAKGKKILQETSKETSTFIELEQTSKLVNRAESIADPTKMIELRAGDLLADKQDAIIVSNDDTLSCDSAIGRLLVEKFGALFENNCRQVHNQNLIKSNGSCFAVQTENESIPIVINVVIQMRDIGDANQADHKSTIERFIVNALMYADQQKFTSISLSPMGMGQGFDLNDCVSALINACFSCIDRFDFIKLIRIFDIDDSTIRNINQMFVSQEGPKWNVLTQKMRSVSSFLQKQHQKMVEEKKNAQSIVAPSTPITSQWYWREDTQKITPMDRINAINEAGKWYIPYDFDQNLQIIEAKSRGLDRVLVVGDKRAQKSGFSYLVDFTTMRQKNTTTGFEREMIEKKLSAPIAAPSIVPASPLSIASSSSSRPPVPTKIDEDDVESLLTFADRISVRIVAIDQRSADRAVKLLQSKIKHAIKERVVHSLSPITPAQKDHISDVLQRAIEFRVDETKVVIKDSKDDLVNLVERISTYLNNQQGHKTYPSTWNSTLDPDNPFNAVLVKISPSSAEYQEVESIFRKTLPSDVIVSIERIENRTLWDQYRAKVEGMKIVNGGKDVEERKLFHGTSDTNPSDIYNGLNGFDSNFCTRGMWGIGTYFAVNGSYSKSYSFKSVKGKMMFLCRVAVGDFVVLPPDGNLKIPPLKPPGVAKYSTQRYDSVSGSTGDSQIFVTYHDNMAYPEYLITFTEKPLPLRFF